LGFSVGKIATCFDTEDAARSICSGCGEAKTRKIIQLVSGSLVHLFCLIDGVPTGE
jgi:hypothetical protein